MPPLLTTSPSTEPPLPKDSKRFLNVAIAGCSHGEMDRIYSSLAEMERKRNVKFDLLICCGDYEALRNKADLQAIKPSSKTNFQKFGTFHQYYSGQKDAPVFTIFIGGNHESSGFLAELPNGGWVAPMIYYMGYSNVVRFAGITIGGLSGIYKPKTYHKGHFERPPFQKHGSLISVNHVRSIDIFKLQQLAPRDDEPRTNRLDIMISHDWPARVTDYGDTEHLLRDHPNFGDDIRKGCLGNIYSLDLLKLLKPQYWFSAHLHCHYEAKVHHNLINEGVPEETKFLALGRPGPNHKFIEAIKIPLPADAKITFEYDPLWCAILKNTDHLMKATSERLFIPSSSGPEQWDFRPIPEQIERVRQLFGNDFTVPENFELTAPPHRLTDKRYDPCLFYLNPQTTEFCDKLQITNFNQLLYLQTEKNNGIPYSQLLERDTDRSAVEEIVAGNIDYEEGINELGDEFRSLVVDSHIESETPQLNPVVASESLEDLIVVEQET